MLVTSALIDDLSHEPPLSAIGTKWQLFTDGVMGGVSQGTMVWEVVAGRPAIHLRGDVSLENNGGFIQISLDLAPLDLAPEGENVDASAFVGIELDVYGRKEGYDLRLRTSDLTKPWQSYRSSFDALPEWRSVRLAFDGFDKHRTDIALNITRLRRVGIVAIGRAFSADLALGGMRFFA
jgi:hypothetical protein